MRFFHLCIVFLTLSACQSKDKTAPFIESEFVPISFSQCSYQDSLHVKIHLETRDEFGIESLQYFIIDLNGKVWKQSNVNTVPFSDPWVTYLHIPMDSRYMPSGEYYVKLVANDGTQESISILSFHYTECPLERTFIFLEQSNIPGVLENWNTNGNYTNWDVSSDFSTSHADPFHQLVWQYHNSLPLIQAWTPLAASPEWTVSTASLAPVQQMISDPGNSGAWILSQDGGIELINEKGIRLKNATEMYTEQIGFYQSNILLSQVFPGNPAQIVSKNKTTWGHQNTWVHGKNIQHFFVLSHLLGIVYLENNTYRIQLLNLENWLEVNWHPLMNLSWSTLPVIAVDGDLLWLAVDNQLSAYNSDGIAACGPFAINAQQISISPYDHGIWIVNNGQIQLIQPNNGAVAWSSPGAQYKAVWDMTNK
jgi:hypothetical protein